MDFATLACIFLFIISISFLLLPSRRLKLPPGPFNLPIIGSLHRLGDLPHKSLHKLSRKHGPLMYLRLGSVPTVVASSADVAKEVLKTHDLDCCSRPPLTSLRKLSYGFSDIGFSPYGEQWRQLRKVSIIQLFGAKKVALSQSIREEEVERMIDSVSARSSTDGNIVPVNLGEELSYFAANVTFRTALGARYFSGERAALRRILSEMESAFVAFFFADYIPMFGFLDRFTGARARLEQNFRELDCFYQRVIDEHLDPARRAGDRAEDPLDELLGMAKEGTNLTFNHVKGVLMDIFSAGSETSAAAIEWAMTELMRNPEAMKKVQSEVRGLVGNERKTVSESDLNQFPYLKSVVKETMRLHPPVPLLLQKETIRHCKINGYDVPAKTRLIVNAWAIGRDEGVWKRPDEFYPERFMNSPIDYRGHHFELIPFGAGRRICAGMNGGILVVELGLANLLYHFNWKLPEGISKGDIGLEEAHGLVAHKKETLYVVATAGMKTNE